jgi:hypothetical protein
MARSCCTRNRKVNVIKDLHQQRMTGIIAGKRLPSLRQALVH